jgi:hypothetical protein
MCLHLSHSLVHISHNQVAAIFIYLSIENTLYLSYYLNTPNFVNITLVIIRPTRNFLLRIFIYAFDVLALLISHVKALSR